jgi:hypothetical protein
MGRNTISGQAPNRQALQGTALQGNKRGARRSDGHTLEFKSTAATCAASCAAATAGPRLPTAPAAKTRPSRAARPPMPALTLPAAPARIAARLHPPLSISSLNSTAATPARSTPRRSQSACTVSSAKHALSTPPDRRKQEHGGALGDVWRQGVEGPSG